MSPYKCTCVYFKEQLWKPNFSGQTLLFSWSWWGISSVIHGAGNTVNAGCHSHSVWRLALPLHSSVSLRALLLNGKVTTPIAPGYCESNVAQCNTIQHTHTGPETQALGSDRTGSGLPFYHPQAEWPSTGPTTSSKTQMRQPLCKVAPKIKCNNMYLVHIPQSPLLPVMLVTRGQTFQAKNRNS